MFGQLSVKLKLGLLVACCLCGFAVSALYSYDTLKKVKVNGPIYRQIVQGKDLIADILPPPEYLVESYLLAFQMLDAQDRAALGTLMQRSHTLVDEFEARHTYWEKELEDGPVKRLLTQGAYQPGHEFLTTLTHDFLPAITAGEKERARTIAGGVLKHQYETHRAAVDELVARVTAEHAAREQDAAAIVDSKTVTMTVLSAAAVAAILALSAIIAVGILRPVRQLHQAIVALAEGDGDLTRRLPTAGQDELTALCKGFNMFLDKLHRTMSVVAATTGTVATATQRLSATIAGMAGESQRHARRADQLAAAAEEMSVTSAEMAKNAQHVDNRAQDANRAAEQGHAVAAGSMTGLTKLAQMVQESSTHISGLGQRSDQIGMIVKVIQDLADQTNLLALNAAIEAARAGEQGRGFAVVADEVRKLAERTTKATSEIADTVRAIQAGTHQAVGSMQAGSLVAQDSMQSANQAGQQLGKIVAAAQQVSGLIQQIAASVEEQSTTSRQLSADVQGMAVDSKQREADLAQASASCSALARTSEELKNVVGTFVL